MDHILIRNMIQYKMKLERFRSQNSAFNYDQILKYFLSYIHFFNNFGNVNIRYTEQAMTGVIFILILTHFECK